MTRRINTALVAVLLAASPLRAVSSPDVRPLPSAAAASIDVWTSGGEAAVYRTGEEIAVYLRASHDGYVTLYDIGTDGSIRLLFPSWPDDGFVFGGMTVRLPDYYEWKSLRITGPRGVEYLHAVLTDEPVAHLFPVRNSRYDLRLAAATGDPYLAMNAINERLFRHSSVLGAATTSFFVESRVWYPRYYCASCHSAPRFDPYDVTCTRYVIRPRIAHDYWWAHDYHPTIVRTAFIGPFWSVDIRVGVGHRHARYRWLDCAWGMKNWAPLRPPVRPYVHVVTPSPRYRERREYERTWTSVTVRDTRTRIEREEPRSRSGGASRTRTAADVRGNERTRDDAGGRLRTSAPSRMKDAEITPRSRDAEITPRSRDAEITPRSRDAEITPRIRDAEITPRIRDAEITPRSRDAEITPRSRSSNVSPPTSDHSRSAAGREVPVRERTARPAAGPGGDRSAESPGRTRNRQE